MLVLCVFVLLVSGVFSLIHPVAGAVVLVLLSGALGTVVYLLSHRVKGSWFDSKGVRIHYTDEGSGEAVVLVHGLAVNADINWRIPGVIRRLRDRYRVIALDVRGHGLSVGHCLDRPRRQRCCRQWRIRQWGGSFVPSFVRGEPAPHSGGRTISGSCQLTFCSDASPVQ